MNPQQSTRLCDIKYKIVFLGDMYTGKSSIIDRFAKNRFDDRMQQTVGIDLISKNISYKQNIYKLQLWDTAGQQKYRSLVPNYVRDAHCAVFVYDITDQKSFDSLNEWYAIYKNYQPQGSIAILIGNKVDKISENSNKQQQNQQMECQSPQLTTRPNLEKSKRKISIQKAYNWAKQHQMAFAQVSAKNGTGVQDVFYSIVQNIDISFALLDKIQKQQACSTKAQTSLRRTESNKSNKSDLKSSIQISSSGRLNKNLVLKLKEKPKRQFACCYI